MSSLDQLRDGLRSAFAARPEPSPRLFAAPGRVNLIGEHTDYNDGFVLPMAIERATLVAAAPRNDRKIAARSLVTGQAAEIDLDAAPLRRRGTWVDYLEGVARVLEARGTPLVGADLLITSDVPIGAGLSSSAALEISVGLALLAVAGHHVDGRELARAGQSAEHEYVGTRCGIMDQLVVALGRADHALAIDCRSLDAAPLPMPAGCAVLICDSGVKHELASSAYNERRAECTRSVALLRAVLPDIGALRDVTTATFAEHELRLPEPLRRRARHVVHENARTQAAAEALRASDVVRLGQLMYASHASLRDDYEVSAPELDFLVELARALPGVHGARMTGGGFGGCAVVLVDERAVERATAEISSGFATRFGRRPQTFVTRAADGGRELP